ncbi:MAG: response regulator transcription factor, partial [Chitinophagaceae bacterium]|nr:response regulator transcription factor [Chitinophagaceae bacterium]
MAIRVFVYDDNQSRVDSLEALLELSEEIRFVGYANDCRMVVQDIEKNAPDVVLMDINMPHVDGIEGLQAIKKQFPEIRVLMQTAFDDSDKIFRSIERGA